MSEARFHEPIHFQRARGSNDYGTMILQLDRSNRRRPCTSVRLSGASGSSSPSKQPKTTVQEVVVPPHRISTDGDRTQSDFRWVAAFDPIQGYQPTNSVLPDTTIALPGSVSWSIIVPIRFHFQHTCTAVRKEIMNEEARVVSASLPMHEESDPK